MKTFKRKHKKTTYLDLRPVWTSSCWIACTLDEVCFSYCTLSIVGLVSLRVDPWKLAAEITPPELMFWSTLVWLLLLWLSWANEELPAGTIGDARPTWGLARWLPPAWLFVKCWYKLPWLGGSEDVETDIVVGLAVCIWAWFVTIVDTVELLLVLLLLLLLFVGNWIPGTVVADERGTETTRLSPCCLSSFILTLLLLLLLDEDDFAWIFCVITCDLFPDAVDDVDEVAGGDEICGLALEAIGADDELFDECREFGLTFWMFGSCVAAAGVAWEFKSVLA